MATGAQSIHLLYMRYGMLIVSIPTPTERTACILSMIYLVYYSYYT